MTDRYMIAATIHDMHTGQIAMVPVYADTVWRASFLRDALLTLKNSGKEICRHSAESYSNVGAIRIMDVTPPTEVKQ